MSEPTQELSPRVKAALFVVARGIWRDKEPAFVVKALDPENIHHRALIDTGADSFVRMWTRRDLVRVMLFKGDAWLSTHIVSVAEFNPEGFESLVARVIDLEDHVAALEARMQKQEEPHE
jgi:hypothetical protein